MNPIISSIEAQIIQKKAGPQRGLDLADNGFSVFEVDEGPLILGSMSILEPPPHLPENHPGDIRQFQCLSLLQGHPMEFQEFARSTGPWLALDQVHIGHKKAGIESTISVGRGNGSRHQVQRVQTRIDPVLEKIIPLGRSTHQRRGIGLAQDQTRFFERFANRRHRQSSRASFRYAQAQALQNGRMQVEGRPQPTVPGVDLPPRKHELIGHKFVPG